MVYASILPGGLLNEATARKHCGEPLHAQAHQLGHAGGLGGADVRPDAPERRLAEPRARADLDLGLHEHGRGRWLLRVPQSARREDVRVAGLDAGLEEVVPRREHREVDRLPAELLYGRLVHMLEEPEEGVAQELRAADLPQQLRAQGEREEAHGGDVLDGEGPRVEPEALRRLLLDADGKLRADEAPAQELPQGPHPLVLLLHAHLHVHHLRGQRGHQRAEDKHAEEQAGYVELALEGVHRAHLHGARCHL
mmetsp:Transcript_4176/g.13418  ORF Transcript_4176/g.13418 Transcript_4176/m.13418 type:complete len:252 (+) Transcript_4176:1084-1839(+)